ncbi:MAG: aldo/keto reductase, partial [Synergistaceae bacterium]|nr:aldo/keto reductase [Synergistaceae bacterium]
MLYRETPRTKEKLSVLGFGCMRLPMKDGQVDEATASRMMHTAVEKGINYVDTAWPYHGGQGETVVGRLLKGLRDKVQLATKLPSWLVKTREDMDDFLDKQLAALQTDHF